MADTAPTEQQISLAVMIDQHVKAVVTADGGDEELLETAFDHMATFKQLLDTYSAEQMNTLCDRYHGFFRFAKLMEQLAEGIADGRISVLG